ncbi:MAG TPA: S9 family peptidase [Acidimicrobiales bacterium]|nr:S9 family peptidase [Acidimicrobiales bacterium]
MTPPPLRPPADFFASPHRTAATISPDGSTLAYLAPEDGQLNVWVRSCVGGEETCVTHDRRRGIASYWWSQDSGRVLYLQDQAGEEKFHLFSVDVGAAHGPPRDLTPLSGAKADLLALPRGHPDVAVVVLNARSPELFDAYRIDIATGQMTMAAQNPGSVSAWIPDVEGQILAALAMRDDGDCELLVRSSEKEPFRVLRLFSGEDLPFPVPGRAPLVGFTPAGDALWLASAAGVDRFRLMQINLDTGAETVIDADEEADLVSVVRHPRTGAVLAACYLRDRAVTHPLEPGFAAVLEGLRQLNDGDPVSFSTETAARRWVVTYESDRDPGTTYLLDRAGGEPELLFRSRPWITPETLAPVESVTIRALDGLALPCYLTLPVGVEPRRLPAVLLVHGGPWFRDTWRYNPEVQFLANRGYAVLQTNFRGSVGFGKAFMRAAIGEFARSMHDDLIDTVSWAVEAGYVDPARVAIVGYSYGGYAALVGAAFTPEVFAAAVAHAGPSNLVDLIRSFPPYWRPLLASTWFRYVGDPGTAEEPNEAAVADLLARSPISRVEEIRTPLLVIHGDNDARVARTQSDDLVARLQELGRDVRYVVNAGEGHGVADPGARVQVYRKIESFLAEHLGGRWGE